MEQLFREIKRTIDGAKNILLVSHEYPDGDALGSMLALKIALNNLDKQADAFSVYQIPPSFKFLPHIGEIKKKIETVYDLIFGVDYGDFDRLETIVSGACLVPPSITFDHHPLANQTGHFKIIDPDFSSTCEIVYQFLTVNSLKIDKEIATCLLTGIFTDTWSFRHPNTTSQTLKIVGELLLKGALVNKVAKLTSQNNIGAKSKLWARALSNMNSSQEFGFVSCFLSHQDLVECQATPEDISGLSSLFCSATGAKFSLLLTEVAPEEIEGSLRSGPEQGVAVDEIAKKFGGGGHKLSAGFKFQGKPEAVLKKIKNLINPHTKQR